MKILKKALVLMVAGAIIKKIVNRLAIHDEFADSSSRLENRKRSFMRELRHLYYKLYYHTH